MKKTILFLLPLALLACTSGTTETTKKVVTVRVPDINTAFEAFTDSFINHLWLYQPEWATQVGYHKNDNLLILPNDSSRQAYLAFAQRELATIEQFHPDSLTASQRIDQDLVRNELEKAIWSLTQLKQYEWDPSLYNPTGLIAFMLSENYAPISERLSDIYERLLRFPDYYLAAAASLRNPVPELKTLAIQQLKGGIGILEKELKEAIQTSGLPDSTMQLYATANQKAIASVNKFVQVLQTKKYAAARSFRLGKDLYEQKFNYDIQAALSAAQLYENAVNRKHYLHSEMAKISYALWPKYFGGQKPPTDTLSLIGKVIDTLSAFHVQPTDFQDAIEEQLPQLTQFIKDKDLLYLDESKPLVVRKEPAYMAGVAGASISAPGPYDQGGNTYYNVGSLEGWSKEKAESYLREYNDYILQILNIHEAIPGHYTQLVYANRSPSLVKSIFANGAMIEGWAVYTELMMLENGYGKNAPEMWLMWYKWHLRTVCNTILDYDVHVNNMTKTEALHLLIKEAFQQRAEAMGKWNRVNVSSVQLTSYYAGYQEIYDLREKLKQTEGKAFNLRLFHEKFLSYGNAPVKHIAELMLGKSRQQ